MVWVSSFFQVKIFNAPGMASVRWTELQDCAPVNADGGGTDMHATERRMMLVLRLNFEMAQSDPNLETVWLMP